MSADFPGGGETGALVRALDWSKTPLGPSADWPMSLKSLVRSLLHAKQMVESAGAGKGATAAGSRSPRPRTTRSVPSIDRAIRTRALRAGFRSHVPKPVEATELLAVIASVAPER